MDFNRYIYSTKQNSQDGFVNSVNKKFLPADAKQEEFEKFLFLKEQENEVVENYIKNFYMYEKVVNILVVPTWQCNLRCTHCCVIDKLTNKKLPHPVKEEQYINFVEKIAKNQNVQTIAISFVGGETLLEADFCQEIHDKAYEICTKHGKNFIAGLTTNATTKLTDKNLEFLKNLKGTFSVSLDGIEEYHKNQRIPLSSKLNPYKATIDNIKKFVDLNLSFRVQAAVNEEHVNETHILEYYKLLLKLGVPEQNISFGTTHPVDDIEELTEKNIKHFQETTRSRPCCRYRGGGYFLIDFNGDIYTNYYVNDKNEKLGNILFDTTEDIIKNSQEISARNAVVLKDENCLKCPVIGFCWGGCVNLKMEKPSEYCDQKKLIEKVKSHYLNDFK